MTKMHIKYAVSYHDHHHHRRLRSKQLVVVVIVTIITHINRNETAMKATLTTTMMTIDDRR